MPTALIGAAITGGASLIGGLLGGPAKNTSTSNTTSTSTPTFTAGQTALQNQEAGILQSRLANPTDQFTAQKTAALQTNNNNFATANSKLQQSLAERGFSGSGKYASGLKSNAVAQAGVAGGIEGQFQGLEAAQQEQNLQDALKFSFSSPGTTSTGSSSGTGTAQAPGGVLGGALAGGAQTATFLYALNHLMGGGGSGGGSGGGGVDDGSGVFE
jgi:hypothetical protein